MSTFTTEAIPLRIQPYVRADALVYLHTRSNGVVTALVRSGQKITSKLAQRLHSIQEIEVMLAPGRQFLIVAGVVTRRRFEFLELEIERRLIAKIILDVCTLSFPPEEVNTRLYDAMVSWLAFCNTVPTERVHPSLAVLVIWRLLTHIGLTPQLDGVTDEKYTLLFGILQAPSEASAFEYIMDVPIEIQIQSARLALPQIQYVLETDIKGLRVYRDMLLK